MLLTAQFGHTRFADLAGHWWRRQAEKQKGPNLGPQLRQLQADFVWPGSSPQVARAVPQPRGCLGQQQHRRASQSHARCHGLQGWRKPSTLTWRYVPLWKKMEAITICRLLFFHGIDAKLNRNCIFCCSGKQNIYKQGRFLCLFFLELRF